MKVADPAGKPRK